MAPECTRKPADGGVVGDGLGNQADCGYMPDMGAAYSHLLNTHRYQLASCIALQADSMHSDIRFGHGVAA
jgi:hypothetical protein